MFSLSLFVYVAEESSLTRGAARSCISLAAASTRIKRLEEDVGAKLLYRNSQGVMLSPAGESLLHHARRVLQQLDHLKFDLDEYAKGTKGHVRIFANTTAIVGRLPEALGRFLSSHPHVSVDLKERTSHDVVIAVREGQTDLGFVAGNVDTEGLDVHSFGSDELVLVTPAEHPFAALREISFAETLGEAHISLQEGSSISSVLPSIASSIGRSLVFRIQVGSFESMCRLIEAQVGVGIIPRSSAERHARTMRIKLLPLVDDWAVREQRLVIRNEATLPKIARDLMEHLLLPQAG